MDRPAKRQKHLIQDIDKLKEKWMKSLEGSKVESMKYELENPPPRFRKVFAIDSEMVAVRVPGRARTVHKAALVCLVDTEGTVVYRSYITQRHPISSLMTWKSGITKANLTGAPPLDKVQADLHAILKDNILVGHDIKSDLRALEFTHPHENTRDTQLFFRSYAPPGEMKTNLKLMASVHLNREIQQASVHEPDEDALATMDLYLLYKSQMEFFSKTFT